MMKKLPDIIPLFPLTGAILLPKGYLPLNIFEPRYIEMVEAAHDSDGIIGMIQPKGARISNTRDNNDLYGTAKRGRPIYKTGCAGLITKMETIGENQYLVILNGISRFEILEELPMVNSYREARVSNANFSEDGNEKPLTDKKLKERYLSSLKKYFNRFNMDINPSDFSDISDEEIINSMAMICPFDSAEKQLIIETSTLTDRAKLMIKIIDFNLLQHDIASEGNLH